MVDITFLINSVLLGVGLAMDAFSVSLANGLGEPNMKKTKTCTIAGTFALFQALMPMIGWLCVHTVVRYFKAFEEYIPYIALILLGYIGGKMLYDSYKSKGEEEQGEKLTFSSLIVQGIATSIDALSVGFTIAEYDLASAIMCAVIIASVTFVICLIGVSLGKRAGTKLSGKAGILGGVILICIGLEIFLSGILK